MRYLLPFVLIFLTQCDFGRVVGVDDCNEGFFSPREDVGTYDIKQIPDMEVALGDTVWFKQSDYWKAHQTCDGIYAVPNIISILSDYETVTSYASDEFIGLIPKKEGESLIQLFSRVQLRRGGNDFYNYELQTFKVIVRAETTTLINQRPGNIYKPFFTIDTVIAGTDAFRVGSWIELDIKTEVLFSEESYFSLEVISGTDLDSDTQLPKGYYQEGVFEEYTNEIPWDSSSSIIYAQLSGLNPEAWDGERQQWIEGINKKAAYFFVIKSYPNDVPVEERTFEVLGFN